MERVALAIAKIERVAEVRRVVAFGDTDVYVIVDMPDDVSAASAALTVSGGGGAAARTVVLLTAADLDAATKKTATYRRGDNSIF